MPKGGQREAKGRPREAKERPRGGQGEAKGGQREAKGGQGEAKGRPRGGQERPKAAKAAQDANQAEKGRRKSGFGDPKMFGFWNENDAKSQTKSKKRFLENRAFDREWCEFTERRPGQARPERPCKAWPSQARPFEAKRRETRNHNLGLGGGEFSPAP